MFLFLMRMLARTQITAETDAATYRRASMSDTQPVDASGQNPYEYCCPESGMYERIIIGPVHPGPHQITCEKFVFGGRESRTACRAFNRMRTLVAPKLISPHSAAYLRPQTPHGHAAAMSKNMFTWHGGK